MLETCRETHVGPYRKCPLCMSNFNQNCNALIHFNKAPNIKFHDNEFSGTQVFMCTDIQIEQFQLGNLQGCECT